jgi:hypothetical protein
MSFEDVWALPEGPLDLARLDEGLAALRTDLAIEAARVQRTRAVDVRLRVPRERVFDVLRTIDPDSFVFRLEGERRAQEIEPPRESAATHYRFVITLYDGDDEQAPSIMLYSNEADNRQGWAVAHALFRRLATRMGAEPIEESAEDAMGWDPGAILKPPGQN